MKILSFLLLASSLCFGQIRIPGPGGLVPASLAGITFDSGANATPAVGVISLTWSHTVGAGSHSVLVVKIGGNLFSSFGTAVCTWNGSETMTLLNTKNSGAGDFAIAVFILVNPTSTTANVSCTGLSPGDWVGSSESYFGVNQSTPNRTCTCASDTPPGGPLPSPTSVTATSSSGDVVTDVSGVDVPAMTVGAGQTSIYIANNPSGDGIAFGTSRISASPTSTTMQWTFTGTGFYSACAVALIPG